MCILLATRAHPEYDLVLMSNRDEFFARKTGPTAWSRENFVLCPTDESLIQTKGRRGTWFGVNRDGKIASVLNLRTCNNSNEVTAKATKSRGLLPVSFLIEKESSFEGWDSFSKFKNNYPDLSSTGQFNLFYGDCANGVYRIIDSTGNTFEILHDNEYAVVSNCLYHEDPAENSSWGKIRLARQGLRELIERSTGQDEAALISNCFALASSCPFKISGNDGGQHVNALEFTMNTIFTPPLKVNEQEDLGTSLPIGEYYGTRSQIVVLVSKDRTRIKLVERTLHSSDSDINECSPSHPKEVSSFDLKVSKK